MLRSDRRIQVALAVLVLAALIGAAKLVAWHSSKPVITSRTATKTPPALVLTPDETLVTTGSKPGDPLMPHYSAPQPPPAAPTPADQPQTPAAASAEAKAALQPQRTPAEMPSAAIESARARPAPSPALPPSPAPARSSCERCGEVVGVTVWPDMAEVRVRFEDGSTRSVRAAVPAPWHVGDFVRLEAGRLVRD